MHWGYCNLAYEPLIWSMYSSQCCAVCLWLSARLQYLHCLCTGDTATLHMSHWSDPCTLVNAVLYDYGLVQDCSISIANTLEILQSCTKTSMKYCFILTEPTYFAAKPCGYSQYTDHSERQIFLSFIWKWTWIWKFVNPLRQRQNGCHFPKHFLMQMYESRFRFHWNLFLRIEFKYSSIGSHNGLAPTRRIYMRHST